MRIITLKPPTNGGFPIGRNGCAIYELTSILASFIGPNLTYISVNKKHHGFSCWLKIPYNARIYHKIINLHILIPLLIKIRIISNPVSFFLKKSSNNFLFL